VALAEQLKDPEDLKISHLEGMLLNLQVQIYESHYEFDIETLEVQNTQNVMTLLSQPKSPQPEKESQQEFDIEWD
jgi:hypothetical protein